MDPEYAFRRTFIPPLVPQSGVAHASPRVPQRGETGYEGGLRDEHSPPNHPGTRFDRGVRARGRRPLARALIHLDHNP